VQGREYFLNAKYLHGQFTIELGPGLCPILQKWNVLSAVVKIGTPDNQRVSQRSGCSTCKNGTLCYYAVLKKVYTSLGCFQ